MLNALPKSQHVRGNAARSPIWHAVTRAEALVVFDHSVGHLKAVEKLTKNRDELLAFYDFPAEHWQRVRTTNPIESTFATVRHRTTRTRNGLSRATFLGMAFQLIELAEKSWRRIRGVDKLKQLLKGIPFQDGTPLIDSTPTQQSVAA